MKPLKELTCSDTEDGAHQGLQENPQYDIIPITSGGPIISGGKVLSFMERGRSSVKRIQIQDVTSGGTSIPDVVDSSCHRCFVFVVGRHE